MPNALPFTIDLNTQRVVYPGDILVGVRAISLDKGSQYSCPITFNSGSTTGINPNISGFTYSLGQPISGTNPFITSTNYNNGTFSFNLSSPVLDYIIAGDETLAVQSLISFSGDGNNYILTPLNTVIANTPGIAPAEEYYPLNNPSGFITGINTGNFITTSQTGNTASITTLNATGSLLQSEINSLQGVTGSNYQATNPSGFITGVNTGNFITTSQTGNFISSVPRWQNIVIAGDSQQTNYAATPWNKYLNIAGTTVNNVAIAGTSAAQWVSTYYSSLIHPLAPTGSAGQTACVIYWLGGNDINNNGSNSATINGYLDSLLASSLADGFSVIFMTLTNWGVFNSTSLGYVTGVNTHIQTGMTGLAGVIDTHAIIGNSFGNQFTPNLLWSSDTVHPSNGAQQIIFNSTQVGGAYAITGLQNNSFNQVLPIDSANRPILSNVAGGLFGWGNNGTPQLSTVSGNGSIGFDSNANPNPILRASNSAGGTFITFGFSGNAVSTNAAIYASGFSGILNGTGNFLTASQTGNLYPAYNPSGFITTAQTGAFAQVKATTSITSGNLINWNLGNTYSGALTGNTSYAFSGNQDGQTVVVALSNTGSNSFTATWPGIIKWPSSTAPTQSTGAHTDVLTFIQIGTGTIYGSAVQNF